ncbi:ribosome small subunit-dependent GTPase A [Mammaliicoccus sp. Dog046]|uniref:ribosome small subunit-dependent GTPase A n=1 Tax=Mammaliicoccus sp. Dog046 TaxID=3034233 RepID=UPI002B25DCFC|nr:ribosome small subunit-dependent GTPase A [Mammaliicoccus sp. Dog046]WQK86175.1 ribosome small subunit-dependent GTPase A [Mammaliicoccus sp. Dog046]
MNLFQLGIKQEQYDYFNEHYTANFQLGRISFVAQNHFKATMIDREIKAEISQKLVLNDSVPAIGDWVVLNQIDDFYLIVDILPRISELKRQSKKHETLNQYIATNLDEVFVVMGLDGDFNINRLERYITQIIESRAYPVVILNKMDAVEDYMDKVNLVQERIIDIPVIVTSVIKNINIEKIKDRFYEGMTATIVGSSGVGKSSIANKLIGKEQLKVNETRENDSKGRHTTTHRGLYLIELNGIIIDTPGMRSLSLSTDIETVQNSFEDIFELAKNCKFNNCSHKDEPGCNVQDAIENGELDELRFNNYLKLLREVAHSESKTSKKASSDMKKVWKKQTKQNRNRNKVKY